MASLTCPHCGSEMRYREHTARDADESGVAYLIDCSAECPNLSCPLRTLSGRPFFIYSDGWYMGDGAQEWARVRANFQQAFSAAKEPQ